MNNYQDRIASFVDGLGLKSSSQISSAIYISKCLDGFPNDPGDFKYEKGFGILSPYILRLLPPIIKKVEHKTYELHPRVKRIGEILSGFSDLKTAATYLYLEQEENFSSTKRLPTEINEKEMKTHLKEMEEKIASIDISDEKEDAMNQFTCEGYVSLPCGHVLPHTYIEDEDIIECRGITEDIKGRTSETFKENEKCDKVYKVRILYEVIEDGSKKEQWKST